MPTIYRWTTPLTVSQTRYDKLITRTGYFATSTLPPSTNGDRTAVAPSQQFAPPRFRFQYLNKGTLLVTAQSGHGYTKSGNGTQTDDTTTYVKGNQSVKIVTDGVAGTCEARGTISATDLSNKNWVLWVMVPDLTHLADIQVRFSSNGFTDIGLWRPGRSTNSQKYIEPNVWTPLSFSMAEIVSGISWNDSGLQYTGVKANVNWAAITGVRFRVTDDGVAPTTVYIGGLEYMPQLSTAFLTFVFDDSRKTHLTEANRRLSLAGLNATYATIGRSVMDATEGKTTAYVTVDELKRIKQGGLADIAFHSWSNAEAPFAHRDGYDGLSAIDGENDILTMKKWCYDNGFLGSNGCILPHGTWNINQAANPSANTDVMGMIVKYFDYCRTTNSNILETAPPANPFKLRARTVSNTDTSANLIAVIDQAIAGKSHAIITFHDIVTPATDSTDCTPTNFQAVVDAVVTRVNAGTLKVRTLREIAQFGYV